jgi:hypothetical protein
MAALLVETLESKMVGLKVASMDVMKVVQMVASLAVQLVAWRDVPLVALKVASMDVM